MYKLMTKISNSLYAAWVTSLLATFGSLFFSEIMEFVPCSLCWYQRIFMYPIAITLTIGIFKSDQLCAKYSFPFSLLGSGFSLYHNLLMWEIIPETMSPCRSGIPCSARYIDYFGFITIPFLSLVAFTLLVLFLFQQRKTHE